MSATEPADRRLAEEQPSAPEPAELIELTQLTQPTEPLRPLARDEECQAIDELIARVRAGLSGALVISGEAGIGKTRLLRYAAEAAAGLQTAHVVGVETESQLGYAALHRLLQPFLDRLDRLPEPQREALGTAFGLVAAAPADRFRTGLATLTLLSEVVRGGPLMCFVDDAQWLDRESLEVLAFVGRRLHADSVGLVLCARDGEPGDLPIEGLPAIRLAGLSDADAARLVAALPVTAAGLTGPAGSAASAGSAPSSASSAPATTAWAALPALPAPDASAAENPAALRDAAGISRIIAEAGGNPLALTEFAADLASGAPSPAPLPLGSRLEAHFRRQADALPPETKTLLLLLSVAPADDPVVLWLAAGALGLSAQALDPAVARGIVTTDPGPAFRHPLIRSAVHSAAAPAELRRVHQALADVTDPASAPDRRAWHLAEAVVGLDEEVAAELERVAEHARGRGGYAAQAAFLLSAAELTPDPLVRAERYSAAAQAHLFTGKAAVVRPLLDRAEAGPGTPATRATALRLRATIEWLDGRIAMTPAILMAAAHEVLTHDEPLARDMVFEALSAAVMTREHTVGITLGELARQALAMPWDRSRPPAVPDLVIEAYCTRVAEGYAAAVPKLRAAVEALRAGDLVDTGMPIALLAYQGAEELLDDEAYRAVNERFVAVSRDRGAVHSVAVGLQSLAAIEIWAGRFRGAESCYDESDDIYGSVINMPFGASHRVELRAWQGLETELRAGVDTAIHVWGEQLGYASVTYHAYHSLAVFELSAGRYQEALALARRGYEDDALGPANRMLPDVIEAAVRAGDQALASAALERLTERASLSGTPWALGLLARCRALMAEDDEADELYKASLKHLEATYVVTDLARTHLLYGEWLRSRERRADARTQLRTAYELFADMGAAGFAERARLELLATGEHARKRHAQADYDLTPQEKQVATLAAGGSTNTEIASRLFITTSTVEYHLNKVFRKLGISSRRQLAGVLG